MIIVIEKYSLLQLESVLDRIAEDVTVQSKTGG